MGKTTWDMPSKEEMESQGSYLKVPGKYLLHITNVDEQPVTKEGNAIDGIKVDLSVADGEQAGKKADIYIKPPNSSHKDGGKFARKIQAAFLIATGLIKKSQLGKPVTVDPQDAKNRMVVAELEFGTDRDGNTKKYLELSYANIWHIDDPDVADFMKAHQKAIAVLPKEHRCDPASFKAAETNGTSQPASQPAADDDLGDV